jgi:hypothetical protein
MASSSLRLGALLVFCAGGIYAAYLTQGIVSESLAMKRYGAESERFTQLEALNGAQSACCFVWAWLILQGMGLLGYVKLDRTARWFDYWQAGITNSIGPAFGMVALKNITYSAQVLVKSCKMVPVMVRCRRHASMHVASSHAAHTCGAACCRACSMMGCVTPRACLCMCHAACMHACALHGRRPKQKTQNTHTHKKTQQRIGTLLHGARNSLIEK